MKKNRPGARRWLRRTLTVAVSAALVLATGSAGIAGADAGPSLTVTPSTDLAPDGSTEITIKGTGFRPDGNGGNGYGLRIGPALSTLKDPGTANGYQLARLVKKGAVGNQVPLGDDGSFSYKAKVKAVYDGSDGRNHDAAAEPFSVYTFAWRGDDSSFDTATPIRFRGTVDPPPPTGDGKPGLYWGFKLSWRNYLKNFAGTTTPQGGAILDPSDKFSDPKPYVWPLESADYDASTSTGTVRYRGAVHFAMPAHFIWDIGLADPVVTFTGPGKATLGMTVNYKFYGTQDKPEKVQPPTKAVIANLDVSGPAAQTADAAVAKIAKATLTDAGAASFNGFYNAGAELDTGDIVFPGKAGPAVPAITVAPASVAQGGSVQVTGTGFTAGEDVALSLRGQPAGSAKADASGGFTAAVAVPAELAPGEYSVAAAGSVSKASAAAKITVTARNVPPPAEGCTLTPQNATKGDLLWGFKKSFREYVGTSLTGGPAKGNSITAGDGAEITGTDRAVADGVPDPDGIPTGAYRFPAKAVRYASPSDFSVQYQGKVTFAYPAHFFTMILANPAVTVSGETGVLKADVRLVAQPGAPASSVDLPQATLAKLTLSGAQRQPGEGTLLVSGIGAKLASSDAFAGFYQTGAELDPATVGIAASCAAPPPLGGDASGTGGTGGGSGQDLVPPLKFRPESDTGALASTGADAWPPLYLGLSLLLGGAALVFVAQTRRKAKS
ncbi:Htaa protein [Amycolatopsis rubida]|uniref:Htaa protein n=1 Tax=Amycolatopsis rubida TaxID=112413 RepID=A0A1I6AP12_9PSEU|nr:Htaa protein [Amycolatopsis rubida]